MDKNRTEILEGLDVFRALEAWGARLYAAWAADEVDPQLRAGHLVIAACEVVIGLGIIVALYRRRVPIDVDELSELRG